MRFKKFEEKKKEFDNKSALYLLSRAFTDLKDSDAYKEKILDGVGNVLTKPSSSNDWAFTSFDKIVLMLKQQIGEENLRNLLGDFSWIKYIDPLFLINCKDTPNFKTLIEGWKAIIGKIEDVKYLPKTVQRTTGSYIDDNDEKVFKDRLSFSLTLATMLLYTFFNKKIPTSVDFTFNVLPSVETSFWITPHKNYDDCLRYLKDNELVDHYSKITNGGIRLLSIIAKDSIKHGLLNSVVDREENKYNIWKELSGI